MVGRICLPKSHPNIKKARKTLLFSFFNSIMAVSLVYHCADE